LGDTIGFVKVVVDAAHNEILGVHMIGPDATELLPELTLAQMWDLSAEEVVRNIHCPPDPQRSGDGGIAGHRRPNDQPMTTRAHAMARTFGLVGVPDHASH